MLNTIVNEMNEPYTLGINFTGKKGYPPKAMIILHKNMNEAYLRIHKEILPIGLGAVPSKSTIQRCMVRIPKEYIEHIKFKV